MKMKLEEKLDQQFASAYSNYNISPFESLKNMVDIFEKAINSYNHSVVDSINIFIIQHGTRELIQYLDEKRITSSDTYFKNVINEWKSKIIQLNDIK